MGMVKGRRNTKTTRADPVLKAQGTSWHATVRDHIIWNAGASPRLLLIQSSGRNFMGRSLIVVETEEKNSEFQTGSFQCCSVPKHSRRPEYSRRVRLGQPFLLHWLATQEVVHGRTEKLGSKLSINFDPCRSRKDTIVGWKELAPGQTQSIKQDHSLIAPLLKLSDRDFNHCHCSSDLLSIKDHEQARFLIFILSAVSPCSWWTVRVHRRQLISVSRPSMSVIKVLLRLKKSNGASKTGCIALVRCKLHGSRKEKWLIDWSDRQCCWATKKYLQRFHSH